MLSSIAAQAGGVVGPPYAASKAGMLGLVHSYACLLVKDSMTANAIVPALIATEMVLSKEQLKPTLVPVGRFGSMNEVSDTAVLLAGNGYITGQTINISGGWYMG
jgi:3-oxoacyl-[acyl-carrier protein] reductase